MEASTPAPAQRDHGLWLVNAQAAPPTAPLLGDRDCDVAVIGAGFTGLSAAIHLCEGGARVVVIDAHYPGFGASGRNGGSVIPGFKLYPAQLRAAYGDRRASAMNDFGGKNVDFTFELIRRLKIEANAERNGWIYAVHAPGALGLARERYDDLVAIGSPLEWLDRDAVAEKMGSRSYFGGWIDRRGGTLQPLRYSRGLAAATLAKGASIYSETPATGLRADATGWTVATPKGSIRAAHVIVATNAYSDDLVPGLKHSVVPLESAQVATEPLTREVLDTILPSGCAVSDSRRSMLYFRRSPDGRFVIGGRGGVLGPTSDKHWGYLRRQATRLYPQLQGVRWEHAWCGFVAITPDFVPHLHEPTPNLHIGLGYYGRGIAMATAFGKLLADRVLNPSADCPVPITPVKPMRLAVFKRLGAAAYSAWYRLQDAVELKRARNL